MVVTWPPFAAECRGVNWYASLLSTCAICHLKFTLHISHPPHNKRLQPVVLQFQLGLFLCVHGGAQGGEGVWKWGEEGGGGRPGGTPVLPVVVSRYGGSRRGEVGGWEGKGCISQSRR